MEWLNDWHWFMMKGPNGYPQPVPSPTMSVTCDLSADSANVVDTGTPGYTGSHVDVMFTTAPSCTTTVGSS